MIREPHTVGFLRDSFCHAYGSELELTGRCKEMYAIIETGGKQYKVSNGDVVYVEKLDAENDAVVEFKVLAVGTDDGIKFGADAEGAKVTGKVIKTAKGKKITVFTYKPKKSVKRKWDTDSSIQRSRYSLSRHDKSRTVF